MTRGARRCWYQVRHVIVALLPPSPLLLAPLPSAAMAREQSAQGPFRPLPSRRCIEEPPRILRVRKAETGSHVAVVERTRNVTLFRAAVVSEYRDALLTHLSSATPGTGPPPIPAWLRVRGVLTGVAAVPFPVRAHVVVPADHVQGRRGPVQVSAARRITIL
jgi:hypothetical protein